jgi:hypothetical protein
MVEALGSGSSVEGWLEGRFGKDRVCGVVAADTARKMRGQIRIGLRKTRTLELRLDYLRDAKERISFLGWLGRERRRAVFIATCRLRVLGAVGATLRLRPQRRWRPWISSDLFHPRGSWYPITIFAERPEI